MDLPPVLSAVFLIGRLSVMCALRRVVLKCLCYPSGNKQDWLHIDINNFHNGTNTEITFMSNRLGIKLLHETTAFIFLISELVS
jgi:hypothetical protein